MTMLQNEITLCAIKDGESFALVNFDEKIPLNIRAFLVSLLIDEVWSKFPLDVAVQWVEDDEEGKPFVISDDGFTVRLLVTVSDSILENMHKFEYSVQASKFDEDGGRLTIYFLEKLKNYIAAEIRDEYNGNKRVYTDEDKTEDGRLIIFFDEHSEDIDLCAFCKNLVLDNKCTTCGSYFLCPECGGNQDEIENECFKCGYKFQQNLSN